VDQAQAKSLCLMRLSERTCRIREFKRKPKVRRWNRMKVDTAALV